MCVGLDLLVNGRLNNLIFSVGFQIFKFSDFKWIYKRAKCDPNDLRIAIFPKTLQKIAQRRGALPPNRSL